MVDLLSGTTQPHLPFRIPANLEHRVEWLKEKGAFLIKLPDAELLYCQAMFSKAISDRALYHLLDNEHMPPVHTDWAGLSDTQIFKAGFKNIAWQRQSGRFYGRHLPFPRLTAWYGDAGADYVYSNTVSHPLPWTRGLWYLKQQVERLSDSRFNSVLLNWYRDGNDYLSWHADDEPELGKDAVIASLSFGHTRDFLLRRSDNHEQKLAIALEHGSLLVMRGALQQHWQHAVPKRMAVQGSRVNLTFRWIHPKASV